MEDKEYPDISEEGAKQVQKIMDAFKFRMSHIIKEESDKCLRDLYCDITHCA